MGSRKSLTDENKENTDSLSAFESPMKERDQMEDAEIIRSIEKVALLYRQFVVESKKIDNGSMSIDMQTKACHSLSELAEMIDVIIAAIGSDLSEDEPEFIVDMRSIFLPWRNEISRISQRLFERGSGKDCMAVIDTHRDD